MTDPYAEARERLDRFLQRDHERVSDLGRSLVLDHGHRTVRSALLLHGLSASPTQFSAVAHELYERGYNVFAPRLPRHGYSDRMSDALASLTADDLRSATRESYRIACGLGERAVVVGFSLGGLLALDLAAHEPVERVVAVAPLLGIAFMPSVLGRFLTKLALRRPNRFAWWDPFQRERQLPAHGYPRYATHALARALSIAQELLAQARLRAPDGGPIVLVSNSREAAVNNRAIRRLASRWQAHRADAVSLHEFTGLRPSHDIIEPLRDPETARRVLPILLKLIDA